MRVLVTGGAGFIGSHVVDRLLDDGHSVTVVDDLSTGAPERVHAGATLEVCDIRTPGLEEVFTRARPEAVVHVAAQASVAVSVGDPAADASVNIFGTIALMEACHRAGVRSVVYTSTGGAAYGDTDVLPTPETHLERPTSPYGISKVAAERYVECWAALHGGRAVVLRLANVYGPRQSPHGEAGVVAIFTHRLLQGEPCLVNGDGEQTRDYVYVGDVADALVRALTQPDVTGIFNISTGRETSVNQLYERLCAVTGITRPAEHRPPRPGEQRRSVLDASRAKRVLGWSAGTTLDEGLRRTVAETRGAGSS